MRLRIAGIALGFALAAVLAWIVSTPRTIGLETAVAVASPGDPAAGRIVFFAGGCDSCHMSQGQTDPLRLGGGRPLATSFGIFYPANISPDERDGIGLWTPVDFANALMEGVSPRGTHLFPAFPYTSYRFMTPKDVRDLFAFLKTLPAVQGRPPETSLAFPFNIRRAVGLWKLLYMREPTPVDETHRSESWRFGRYLVEGPGHCAECHSARDFLGGIRAGARLTGGVMPDGKGKAPPLTEAGLKDWTAADIAEALSSGFTPSGDSLGGQMAAVVRNTSELPPAYREAIAEYLKSQRP